MPEDQVAKLYYRDGLSGSEHLLLDPAKLGTAKSHAALDYFTPSWDGRLIAYGVSLGGSEESVLHVLDVAGARTFAEAIDRTMLNVVSWLPDNRGFFYLRYPKPTPDMKAADTLYNARTYRHALGSNPDGDGDPVVFGRGVASAWTSPRARAPTCSSRPTRPTPSRSRTATWTRPRRPSTRRAWTASAAPRPPGRKSPTLPTG